MANMDVIEMIPTPPMCNNDDVTILSIKNQILVLVEVMKTKIDQRQIECIRTGNSFSYAQDVSEVAAVEESLQSLVGHLRHRSFALAPLRIQECVEGVMSDDFLMHNVVISPVSKEILVFLDNEKSEKIKNIERTIEENERIVGMVSVDEISIEKLKSEQRVLLIERGDAYLQKKLSPTEKESKKQRLSEVSRTLNDLIAKKSGLLGTISAAKQMIKSHRELLLTYNQERIITATNRDVFSRYKFDDSIQSKGSALRKAIKDHDLLHQNVSAHPSSPLMQEIRDYLNNSSHYVIEHIKKTKEMTRVEVEKLKLESLNTLAMDPLNPLCVARANYFAMLHDQQRSQEMDYIHKEFINTMGFEYHKALDLNVHAKFMMHKYNFSRIRRQQAVIDLFSAWFDSRGVEFDTKELTYDNLCVILGVRKWYLPIRAERVYDDWTDVAKEEKLHGCHPKRWSI